MSGRMLGVVGVGVVMLGASCSFSADGLDVEGGGMVTANPPSTAPAPSPAGESAPMSSAVMRAHDVKAKRLSVGVLFAHKVQAEHGTVATSGPPLPGAELQAQAGPQDIEAPELVIDVLYAHDVKVEVLSVRELRASEVKIDKEKTD